MKKTITKVLLGIILLVFLIGIVYAVFSEINFNALTTSSLFYTFAQFFGLIGFFSISLLIISGDTARYFDRYFGIDKIIKAQRKFAIFTYFIVFSHPLFFILSQSAFLSKLLPDFSMLAFALGTISLYIFAGIMISSLMYKRISYSVWQYIHIVTYILFVTVWLHAWNLGSSLRNPIVKGLFYLLPALVVIGALYRANYKLSMRKNEFKVKEVQDETPDTFILTIDAKYPVNYKPGQFFFLRIEGENLYARHPFSVANAYSGKELRFVVKNTGRFTQALRGLKNGDKIKVEGPFGNFYAEDSEKDPVFIAGGVGIAPFIGMIEENENKKRDIILLYGVRRERDIILKSKLDSLQGKRFTRMYVISDEKPHDKKYESGRIDKQMLLKYVKRFDNKEFFICGPEAMNKQVSQILRDLGVKRSSIHYEDFFW